MEADRTFPSLNSCTSGRMRGQRSYSFSARVEIFDLAFSWLKVVCWPLLFVICFVASCVAQIPIDRPLTRTPTLPPTVTLIRDIPYDRYSDTTLDIFRLKGLPPGKHPGVVIIHGGGWMNGDKEERLEYAGLKWVEKGFVAAVVNYRLAAQALQ